MRCWIYKSRERADLYLYLRDPEGFADLPEALQRHFGTPELVLELELSADRRLAKEDIQVVMANLLSRGYHLQLPALETATWH